jgi:lipopolysaccharide/colanic/teichoic acid biosynthesis glycosyltransferase
MPYRKPGLVAKRTIDVVGATGGLIACFSAAWPSAHLAPRQRLRMEVRPGITGWAQINGRNPSPRDEGLERTSGMWSTGACG